MREWRIGKAVHVSLLKKEKDDIRKILVECYEGTKTGHSTHAINITLHKDGSVFLSEEGSYENMVYLYPFQVSCLIDLVQQWGKKKVRRTKWKAIRQIRVVRVVRVVM